MLYAQVALLFLAPLTRYKLVDAAPAYSYDPFSNVGPDLWKALAMEGNQCGGTSNSPIALESEACTLFADYSFDVSLLHFPSTKSRQHPPHSHSFCILATWAPSNSRGPVPSRTMDSPSMITFIRQAFLRTEPAPRRQWKSLVWTAYSSYYSSISIRTPNTQWMGTAMQPSYTWFIRSRVVIVLLLWAFSSGPTRSRIMPCSLPSWMSLTVRRTRLQ